MSSASAGAIREESIPPKMRPVTKRLAAVLLQIPALDNAKSNNNGAAPATTQARRRRGISRRPENSNGSRETAKTPKQIPEHRWQTAQECPKIAKERAASWWQTEENNAFTQAAATANPRSASSGAARIRMQIPPESEASKSLATSGIVCK